MDVLSFSNSWLSTALHLRSRMRLFGRALQSSIRRLLVFLVLIAILPALGIILLTGLEARNDALAEAEHNAQQLARGLGDIQERTTLSIRKLLEQLANLSQTNADDVAAITKGFKIIAAAFPMVDNIALVGPDGKILSTVAPTERTNLADLSSLQQAMTQGTFTAGIYQRPSPHAPPTFPFSQPLRDGKGKLVGQVILTLRLDTYGNLFQHADLPPDSVLSIVDRTGRRIFRTPSASFSGIGDLLPIPLRAVVTQKEAVQGVVQRTGADGVDRIYAYSQLHLARGGEPYMTIVVGIPRQQSLERANTLLQRNLYLLGIALFLALTLAWLVGSGLLGRRLDHIMAVTGALGAGDLSSRINAPLGTGALGRLERSVNAMAEALARGAAAAKHAEEALHRANEDLEQRVQERTRELEQANDSLRKSEERYRVLYEQSTVGILVINRAARITDANPAACRMLAYTADELRGLDYTTIITPEDIQGQPVDMEQAMAGGMRRLDRVFQTKNGHQIQASVSGRGISDNLYQAIFRDISARKKLEALREDVERITHHDLKAPLMGIIHVPGMLLKNKALPPRDVELLHVLRESGYRMLRMINMSLALYQMETGTYVCKPESFDIMGTVQRVIHETQPAADSKDIRITPCLDGKPTGDGTAFPVIGEESLCLTMLENLIKNAIEAAPIGSECLINGDTHLRSLRIANQGEVPPDIREHFFEKYVTSGKRWGTGLGTYSAQLIARTNGWHIALHCELPGVTTISLSFRTQETD